MNTKNVIKFKDDDLPTTQGEVTAVGAANQAVPARFGQAAGTADQAAPAGFGQAAVPRANSLAGGEFCFSKVIAKFS